MLHFPIMSILKCSLSKLPSPVTYHSYPLYLDHLQPQHVVATCVTATNLKLTETSHGISIIIKSRQKKKKQLWISLRWHYLLFLGFDLWLLYFHLFISWPFLLFFLHTCMLLCYWSLKNFHLKYSDFSHRILFSKYWAKHTLFFKRQKYNPSKADLSSVPLYFSNEVGLLPQNWN